MLSLDRIPIPIDLTENKLENIDGALLSQFVGTEELILHHNLLSTVPSFGALTCLNRLDLRWVL